MGQDQLVTNEYYHIFSRSIEGFKIFTNDKSYLRFFNAIVFFQSTRKVKFSEYLKRKPHKQQDIRGENKDKLVDIICYIEMPTHVHFILRQATENGISLFMKNLLNSYTRYFNVRYRRKGPLWDSRFHRILIKTDEQLLHLTRYIHLNPVSIGLVKKPEDWKYSSYNEYLNKNETKICHYKHVLSIEPKEYKKFVNSRIEYQKELSKLKKLIIENYSG